MKFLIVSLLALNIYSMNLSRPQMMPRMLKYKQSVLNKYTCHSNSQLKETYKNRESFIAKVSCKIVCDNGKTENQYVSKNFIPKELSLSPGDGSSSNTILWRSLGITLNVFKKQVCFDRAQKLCSGSRINSFKVDSIESGNWKLTKDITCKTKDIINSPFDDKFKLNSKAKGQRSSAPLFPFGVQKTTTSTNKIQEFIKGKNEAIGLENLKDCDKVLTVDTCFGDCVYESDTKNNKWIETISTPKPFGEDSFKICIDSKYEEIKNHSKDVSLFKCEKLIWEYIRTSGTSGESCAAMRYNSNCDELF